MTYLDVLLFFIMPPLAILSLVVPADLWGWVRWRGPKPDLRPYTILLVHVVLALVYTTPWDNYLVANGVWWYAPEQVLGLTLGWVPLEEYAFFVLQTLLTGLWTVALLRGNPLSPRPRRRRPALRSRMAALLVGLWVASLVLWSAGWAPGRYLALILVWGLPPILLQAGFGADILLQNRRVLVPAIGFPTVYLWIVDAVAIGRGTWTIDPGQTTGIRLGNLPVEEMMFFLITNVMVGFGMVLMCSPDSQRRAAAAWHRIKDSIRARSVTNVDLGNEVE